MSTISFMSANYVARHTGYRMTEGWMQGDRTTNDFFRPLETFPERFEQLLLEIKALGFDALDLWTAHLNSLWATPDHLAAASELLTRHGMRVVSIAGALGASREEFEATCAVAQAVGTDLLAGGASLLPVDRASTLSILRERGLRLAVENHRERSPEEVLAQIAQDGELVGAAVDTGWFATQVYDPVRALERLREHLFHVHLKDVRAAGAHESCRFGEGVVPVEACVRTLRLLGYDGPLAVEYEPEDSDPSEQCAEMLAMLRGWVE